jgi:hypothetical protein
LDVVSGEYEIHLGQVAPNCTVPATVVRVSVAPRAITDLAFNVTCVGAGVVRVSTTSRGIDVPSYFYVQIDGFYRDVVGSGNSVDIGGVAPGPHTIALGSVPGNCTVTSANPVNVTVTTGGTTNVAFDVSCVANPTLNVSVTTSGTNIPQSYYVGVDYSYYYYYLYSFSVPANGSASSRIPPGNHTVVLDGLPSNCRVNGSSWFPVEMKMGVTTNVIFNVVCQ